jgi:hypothetical protein
MQAPETKQNITLELMKNLINYSVKKVIDLYTEVAKHTWTSHCSMQDY